MTGDVDSIAIGFESRQRVTYPPCGGVAANGTEK